MTEDMNDKFARAFEVFDRMGGGQSANATNPPPAGLAQVIEQAAALAAPVFAEMGWTYVDVGVPTEAHLRQTIQGLIALMEPGVPYAETGRIRVYRDNGRICIALELASFPDPHPERQG